MCVKALKTRFKKVELGTIADMFGRWLMMATSFFCFSVDSLFSGFIASAE
jgi:ABC-type sulfate transport system substrate-binding protein